MYSKLSSAGADDVEEVDESEAVPHED